MSLEHLTFCSFKIFHTGVEYGVRLGLIQEYSVAYGPRLNASCRGAKASVLSYRSHVDLLDFVERV